MQKQRGLVYPSIYINWQFNFYTQYRWTTQNYAKNAVFISKNCTSDKTNLL